MDKKRHHPANAGTRCPYIYIIIRVEIRDDKTDEVIHVYETDLADSMKRRVFAEQMSEAYAAGQISIVSPIRVQKRLPV